MTTPSGSRAEANSAIVDAAPDALFIVDEAGRILHANPQSERMTGYPLDELLGLPVDRLVPADRRSGHEDLRARYHRNPAVRPMGAHDLALQLERKDGSLLAVDVSLSPGEAGHVIVAVRDASERSTHRRLLAALADARTELLDEAPVDEVISSLLGLLAELVDAPHLGMAVPDHGPFVRWPTTTLAMTDELNGLLHGEDVVVLARLDHPGLAATHGGPLGPTIAAPVVAAEAPLGVLLVGREPGASGFEPYQVSATAAVAAELAVSLTLDRSRRERRRMVLSDDRERIAHGLHDLVIQQLFATGMRLQAATGRPEILESRVAEAIDSLDETIAVIRQTIFELTDPAEDLAAELQQLVARHRAIHSGEVELAIDGDLSALGPDRAEQIVPVVNELLANTERHARALRVDVEVSVDDELRIVVRDDGVGFPETRRAGGLGLRNLTKRAASRGGALEAESEPDRGTTIVWRVPLRS